MTEYAILLTGDRAHGEAGDDNAALVADLRVVADHLP